MSFIGLGLIGSGVLLVWAAVTGENPIAAAGDVLRGREPGTHPLGADRPDPLPPDAQDNLRDVLPFGIDPTPDSDPLAPIRQTV